MTNILSVNAKQEIGRKVSKLSECFCNILLKRGIINI